MTGTDEMPHDVPPGIDQTKPSVARIYDALLGGKDNYEADRRVRDQMLAIAPELGSVAWDNRKFLVRVTRYLAAKAGIEQFLDCGAGLPTAENTHEVAQRANADATVVYIDNDPVAVVHGRAFLANDERTHYIAGDLTKPEQLLADDSITKRFDWTHPIALYQLGTLHVVPDEQRPREIMARFIDALPSGSFVVLSHMANPGTADPEVAKLAERLEKTLQSGAVGTGYFRAPEEITSFFGGLEFLEPGLVPVNEWWPDGPKTQPLAPAQRLLVGGVARKP